MPSKYVPDSMPFAVSAGGFFHADLSLPGIAVLNDLVVRAANEVPPHDDRVLEGLATDQDDSGRGVTCG